MSVPFGSGKNPYSSSGAKDDVFVKQNIFSAPEIKRNFNDISLFDITSEADLNDTGKKFTADDFLDDVAPMMDGAKWLGLTGKGTFAPEPDLMQTSFLKAPPKQTDKDGNPVEKKDNGNDWNWNTFA